MSGTQLTYGELMNGARRSAHQATGALAVAPLADAHAARDALTARAELFAAIGRHVTVLIGEPRLAIWRAEVPTRRHPDERTPAVRAVLAWIDQLERHQPVPEPGPIDDGSVAGPCAAAGHWMRCRELVDHATELVATHHDPAGRVRPGTPEALARADLGPLLADAARLVAVIAPLEPLALRCRQAGLDRAELDAQLPVTDRLLDHTWALVRTLRFPATAVSDLTVARPSIDAIDAGDEWTQRMARVHARLHQHAQRGHVSVRTLHDIARLGLVSSHILDTSGHRDHAQQSAVTDQWRAVLAHLDPLRSIQRHDRGLRLDVERMLHVARTTHAMESAGAAKRLLGAVATSIPTMDACAAIADRLLAGTADAWIPAPPRRGYLPDPHLPGQAASRAPPQAVAWPRSGLSRAVDSGLVLP